MKTKKTIEQVLIAAYNLSKYQGMGFLHARSGTLPQRDAELLCQQAFRLGNIWGFGYVLGRAVKLNVKQLPTGELDILIDEGWYDHTKEDIYQLIKELELYQWRTKRRTNVSRA